VIGMIPSNVQIRRSTQVAKKRPMREQRRPMIQSSGPRTITNTKNNAQKKDNSVVPCEQSSKDNERNKNVVSDDYEKFMEEIHTLGGHGAGA